MIRLDLFRTFRGGVRIPADKRTRDKTIEILPRPSVVYIHLRQYDGSMADPVVGPGDPVRSGSVIAACDHGGGVPVHASIDGRIREIADHPHPRFGSGKCCVIEAGESDAAVEAPDRTDHQNLSPDELLTLIRSAGIVGLGGAGFPTWRKLTPGNPIDTLIVNGCESEPMVTSDHRLMVEYPVGVVEGARIFQRIIGAPRLIFAMGPVLKEVAATVTREGGEVRPCPSKFPAGSERQLIKAMLGRTVPRGGLPCHAGCVVCNAATCYAGFQAVTFGKPLIDRVVTVTGDGIAEPKNLLVPVGTQAEDLIRHCGGYTDGTGAIIFGGPMTGFAQPDSRTPLTKETTAVVVLSKVAAVRELPCVRCGRCVDACPMGLMPLDLYRLIDEGDIAGAEQRGLVDCLECGGCAYACPSRLPMVHLFRYGKAETGGSIP